jgi:hypothetical protein
MTSQTTSLPALTGSEKQIAWAENIRQNHSEWVSNSPAYMGDADDAFTRRLLNRFSGIETDEDERMAREAINSALQQHFSHTDAHYWIDNQQDCEDSVLALARPAVIRAKNLRSIRDLSTALNAGTITEAQRGRLQRLIANRAEWDR